MGLRYENGGISACYCLLEAGKLVEFLFEDVTLFLRRADGAFVAFGKLELLVGVEAVDLGHWSVGAVLFALELAGLE